MKEYKEILESEGKYVVFKNGDIKHFKKACVRKASLSKRGYYVVSMFYGGKIHLIPIHRLVATYFILNPENKPCVNHIDGNKLNNNADNLEWCTYSENELHAYKIGIKKPFWKGKFGENHHRSKHYKNKLD